ncbi:MAG TPA: NUDIX hydrolase [Candidatus Baltobacteraceae bacterium]|jgi:ADP-ribose pyrophosphatase|nr:NUDIX hydrolase [Candidatus Baltobacteraceae bacterium]
MDEKPELLSSERVFEGRVFNVRIDRIRFPDGAEHRVDVVEHPGSFTVLAMPSPDEVVLVQQYRHPVSQALWELPAGTAEPGENPAAGAARELAEETGYRAGRMRRLASLFATPGFCTETMHFFVAEELTAGEQMLDEDERIEVGTFTRDAAWRLVDQGQIGDMKTVLALLWTESNQVKSRRASVDM